MIRKRKRFKRMSTHVALSMRDSCAESKTAPGRPGRQTYTSTPGSGLFCPSSLFKNVIKTKRRYIPCRRGMSLLVLLLLLCIIIQGTIGEGNACFKRISFSTESGLMNHYQGLEQSKDSDSDNGTHNPPIIRRLTILVICLAFSVLIILRGGWYYLQRSRIVGILFCIGAFIIYALGWWVFLITGYEWSWRLVLCM